MRIERVGSWPRTPSGVQHVRMLDDIDSTACTPGGVQTRDYPFIYTPCPPDGGPPQLPRGILQDPLKLKFPVLGLSLQPAICILQFAFCNFHFAMFIFRWPSAPLHLCSSAFLSPLPLSHSPLSPSALPSHKLPPFVRTANMVL